MAATLTGSQKQIQWAEDIRKDLIDCLKDECATSRYLSIYLERAEQLLAAVTDSKWWIDHRGFVGNSRRYLCTRDERNDTPIGQGEWTPADAIALINRR